MQAHASDATRLLAGGCLHTPGPRGETDGGTARQQKELKKRDSPKKEFAYFFWASTLSTATRRRLDGVGSAGATVSQFPEVITVHPR